MLYCFFPGANDSYSPLESGCSCGLFLLNFMEYWTGNELSHEFDQVDVKHFRLKLAAILLSSDLNKRKGSPFLDSDDKIGSPGDCTLIENPNMTKSPMKKRKYPDETQITKVPEGTPQLIECTEIFSQVHAGEEPEELWAFQAMRDVAMSKEDLIDLVCDYVIALHGKTALNKPWVKCFHPDFIMLNVEALQQLLSVEQHISYDCFNVAVRFQTYRAFRALKKSNSGMNCHNMDLRFCQMCDLGKRVEYRKKYTMKQNAIGICEDVQYNLQQCRYVFFCHGRT